MNSVTISGKDAQSKYGLSPADIDVLEEQASRGILPGDPGSASVGRPMKFGAPLRMVGFKETAETIEAMDCRASSLGLSRSDYLRYLIDQDLANA